MSTTTRALRSAALALALVLSAACSGDDGAEVRKIGDDDSGSSSTSTSSSADSSSSSGE